MRSLVSKTFGQDNDLYRDVEMHYTNMFETYYGKDEKIRKMLDG